MTFIDGVRLGRRESECGDGEVGKWRWDED